MARVLGIITKPDNTQIPVVFQNVRANSTVEVAEAKAEDGKVTDRAAVSKTKTVNFDGFVNSETPLTIEAGAIATFNAESYLITSIELTQSAGQYQQMSGTMERKDAATSTAYAETPAG